MDRKVKNILIILVIFIIAGLSYMTMKSASNNINSETPPNMPQGGAGNANNSENSQTPPDMPQGDAGNANNSENSQTPPDMPQGGTENSNNNENNQTPPDKPDGDNNQSNSGEQNKNDNGSKQSAPPSGQSNNGQNQMMEKSLSKYYYVLFGLEAFIISALIVYLIMSCFNLKTLNETFASGIKALTFTTIVVVLGGTLTFLQVYITSNFLVTENSQSQGMPQGGGMNGGTNNNVTYTAIKTITEDETIDDETYSSTTSNENGLLADGDIDVQASSLTVTKSGDSNSGDTSNFYGNNSAILAKDKANLTLKNITVTTDASGANGVFSYGGSATTNNSESDGTTVTISDSQITTTGDNAGGIMTTGGGNTVASNLTINTSGTSSAAIRTDRGGGTVTVDKGTYTTTGQGSPTIYSTADISVSNASLISKASEGVVIEGSNSVKLDNCDLTDSNTKLNGQSTTYKNIFLYQSMSGDAKDGTAFFSANNCNIITNNGDTFYITNTTAEIDLTNNTIVNNDSDGNFLRAQKDSWGNSGSNGGNVTLKMTNQKATGNIVVDSISSLDMEMKTNSYYEGTINGDNQAKNITLKLDSSSKIKLTGDSYVNSLDDEDTDYSNIDFNGYTLYVNGVAIN